MGMMTLMYRVPGRVAVGLSLSACLIIFVVAGCASFNPVPLDSVPFLERSQTQQGENVVVTAAVLSAQESAQVFGVKLYKEGIQPVWLEIENNDAEPLLFLPVGLDPEYFASLEAAFQHHFRSNKLNAELDRHFWEHRQGLYIPAGGKRSGFVFTNLDEGTKTFNVDLVGRDQELRTFTFFIEVPGLRPDHTTVDFANLYSADKIKSLDMAGLRQALEQLPCCTTNKSGKKQGDPLNIAVVGTPADVFYAFVRAGWDETETIYGGSNLKTVKSFLFGGEYRYSPISALYVFGRGQDIALQKARDTIHERNHLRLWMTDLQIDGKTVWIGQISRDIGVRFTRKTITTHKIDPDVDETRAYLLQNLWYSQSLFRYAYVGGVGEATLDEPRTNLTGDPYITDGLRVVMWLSRDPVNMEAVDNVRWEEPGRR
jgi:hypothetical protein